MMEAPCSLWLLLLSPAAAILVGFFVFKPLKPEWTHWPILASCAVVAASALHLASLVHSGLLIDVRAYEWMGVSGWTVPFGFRVDGLGAPVLAMASVVGGLIHVFAAGYMKGEEGAPRFFLAFHLFFLGMIGLLVSSNLVQFYLFWELMGAASYLLIGFWWKKESARRAAVQAFLTNRVGDFALMLAALTLAANFFGGTDFAELPAMAAALTPATAAFVGWLFFAAAAAKSAQLPLYFWLPDAMEGPTPVSALMHAATMVTAGIFLLTRTWPLLSQVPGLPEAIAVVGAATSIFAAVIACTRKDLKRILAYSTVSHLGLMALAVGLGQISSAVFHLVTHGFFKAALFLCAGSIAHALHQSTASVDEVGGLRGEMKWTFACFLLAALSASGIYPFAGFYSKDAILDAALHHGWGFGAAGLLIGALSAFYMGRMLFLVFFGARPEQAKRKHGHEMTAGLGLPVSVLALGALAGGLAGAPIESMLKVGWAESVPFSALPEFSWTAAGMGTAAAVLGWGAAYVLTMAKPSWDWQWRKANPVLERAFDAEFGVKAAMLGFPRGLGVLASWLGVVFDKRWWDGLIESSATGMRSLAESGGRVTSGYLSDSLWWLMTGTAVLMAAAVWR